MMIRFVGIDPNGFEHVRDSRRPFKYMVIGRPSPYWALDNVKDARRLASMYSSDYFLSYRDLGCHASQYHALRNAEAEIRKGKFRDIRIVDLESRVSTPPATAAHIEGRICPNADSDRGDRPGTRTSD